MSRYVIQEESLTSIADEIRILSGIEDTISPDTMETKLQEANTNVNTEANLIEQIQTVLHNKTNVEDVTPEVNVYTEELKNLNNAITALELELRKKTNVDVEINILTKKLSSNGTSISFTGLTEEPKMFAISPTGNITLSTTRYVTSVMYDGEKIHGTYGYRSSSTGTSYYSNSYFTWTYSNGTLTVKTSSATQGGNFSSSVTYQLAYVTAAETLPEVNTNIIQQVSGTFTTEEYDEYNGCATVNCGFKPDIVYITEGYSFQDSEDFTVLAAASFDFKSGNVDYIHSLLYDKNDEGTIGVYNMRNDNGFEVWITLNDWTWESSAYLNKQFSYTAIKYSDNQIYTTWEGGSY